MAKLITLGAAVSATAAAAQAAVDTETSDDNVAWTDAVTVSALNRNVVKAEIELKRYARLNVTAAGTAGTVDAYLSE
jgi:hypothetical protein